MKNKNLDLFTSIIPAATAVIIILSSLKLFIYYKLFNISIVDYIGLEEFITSFIDDIYIYISGFIVVLIIDFIHQKENDEMKSNIKKRMKNVRKNINILKSDILAYEEDSKIKDTYVMNLKGLEKKFLDIKNGITENLSKIDNPESQNPKKMKIKKIILWTSSVIFILLCFILVHFLTSWHDILFWMRSLGMIFLGVLLIYHIKKTYLYVFIGVFWYLFTGIFLEYCIIIENKDMNYTIKYQDTIINTNEKIHFIGKTDSYIFLYDFSLMESSVLSTEELKEIKSRKK